MTNDIGDLLHEDELEPEDLDEDATEAEHEERHTLKEEVAEFAAEEAEEQEPGEPAAMPGEDGLRPRNAEEFVCASCFLIKSRSQLADAARSLCTDCVNNKIRA